MRFICSTLPCHKLPVLPLHFGKCDKNSNCKRRRPQRKQKEADGIEREGEGRMPQVTTGRRGVAGRWWPVGMHKPGSILRVPDKLPHASIFGPRCRCQFCGMPPPRGQSCVNLQGKRSAICCALFALK